jgi:hypothetical protein
MTIKGFIVNKMYKVKFYQATYLDATPLVYIHQKNNIYIS